MTVASAGITSASGIGDEPAGMQVQREDEVLRILHPPSQEHQRQQAGKDRLHQQHRVGGELVHALLHLRDGAAGQTLAGVVEAALHQLQEVLPGLEQLP